MPGCGCQACRRSCTLRSSCKQQYEDAELNLMESRGSLQPARRGGRRAADKGVALAAAALSLGALLWLYGYDAPSSPDAGSRAAAAELRQEAQAGGSIRERIAAAAQRHADNDAGSTGGSRTHQGEPREMGCTAGGVTEDQCAARVAAATAACPAGRHTEPVGGSGMPNWQRFLPPAFSIPGHLSGRQQQQAAQLASAEARSKQVDVFGEEGAQSEYKMPQETARGGGLQGLDYPGVIALQGDAAAYTIGGMGLLRAEPFLKQGAAFYIINRQQKEHTIDSFYVRLVGPSIVMGDCVLRSRQGLKAEYLCEYSLREPGVYTLQAWAEYRNLPADVAALANPKGNHPDPVVANSETFDRAELLLYTSLVDGRYMEGSAAELGAFARGVDLGSTGLGGSASLSALECARGLRSGRWVARSATGCRPEDYRLLREAWEWRPAGCRLREFCGDEGRACLSSRFRTIAVAGDSIARELFDEVGSVMLGRDVSWREIFPHKHASGSRQVGDTMIKMMWLPDPLGTITEQLRGPVQLREQYTEADLLVVSAGYWYIYRTSLESYLEGVRNLTQAVNDATGGRTTVVWVSIPAGWMNFGYRIRPRICTWNEAAAKVVEAAGWLVLDTFHLSDARPEKTDGTHIGNDTDRGNMQGPPTLSKSVGNLLLGALCGQEGHASAPGAAAGLTSAPTLPIEWPNWPNSRRYASREALLRAKGLLPSQAAASGVKKAPEHSPRANKPPQQHVLMLGGAAAAGASTSRHSPRSSGGRRGGHPHKD